MTEHYGANEHFHKVIALQERPDLAWEQIRAQVPLLPRGWFELSRLGQEDRVDFTRDFWLTTLPFSAEQGTRLEERMLDFFELVEDVGIFLTQTMENLPFDVHMIYTIQDDVGFFHGAPPASEQARETLIRQFGSVEFPEDYLAFLGIHDGFSKMADSGLIRLRDMARTYQRFQQLLSQEVIVTPEGEVVHPGSLIPFYEAYGLHCYQCFFTEWFTDREMGNVFFSQSEKLMSNYLDEESLENNGAFASFLHWLVHYIEDL